jgi:hypothetical protein
MQNDGIERSECISITGALYARGTGDAASCDQDKRKGCNGKMRETIK